MAYHFLGAPGRRLVQYNCRGHEGASWPIGEPEKGARRYKTPRQVISGPPRAGRRTKNGPRTAARFRSAGAMPRWAVASTNSPLGERSSVDGLIEKVKGELVETRSFTWRAPWLQLSWPAKPGDLTAEEKCGFVFCAQTGRRAPGDRVVAANRAGAIREKSFMSSSSTVRPALNIDSKPWNALVAAVIASYSKAVRVS